MVSKRIEAGEDPYPITFCERVPSKVYEKEKVLGVQAAMHDLLDHIINDKVMSQREKKKKLKKFKGAYPEIYAQKFPTPEDLPDSLTKMSSFTRLKHVMRLWKAWTENLAIAFGWSFSYYDMTIIKHGAILHINII